jgi:hypothetical protein
LNLERGDGGKALKNKSFLGLLKIHFEGETKFWQKWRLFLKKEVENFLMIKNILNE